MRWNQLRKIASHKFKNHKHYTNLRMYIFKKIKNEFILVSHNQLRAAELPLFGIVCGRNVPARRAYRLWGWLCGSALNGWTPTEPSPSCRVQSSLDEVSVCSIIRSRVVVVVVGFRIFGASVFCFSAVFLSRGPASTGRPLDVCIFASSDDGYRHLRRRLLFRL